MTVNGNSAYGSPANYATTASGNNGPAARYQMANEADPENPFLTDQAPAVNPDLVSLSAASQGLIMADDNRDGTVSKQELANASYQLLNNPNANETDVQVGQLYATMVLGGNDGQGLFPDVNGDGGITANELSLLASGDGLSDSISSEDFSFTFEDNFNPGGNAFSLSDLEAVASGQQVVNKPEAGNTETTAPQEQSRPQEVLTKVISSFTNVLQALINPAQGDQSGSGLMNAFVEFFNALTEAFTQPQAQQKQRA